MTNSEMFTSFLESLKIRNSDQIAKRYGEITASLNKAFRDSESKTANSLQVGSYGRYTGINGISDLDMLYILPKGKWDDYKLGKQYKLLSDTKAAILARYPTTNVRVDRLVVTVTYKNFHIEVQPVFEEEGEDGITHFIYPDTANGGSWKITKPRHEIAAMKEFVDQKNKNLRRLCKMVRAWKNRNGVVMGGLLIDTLAYNYLKSTAVYDNKSFASYGELSRDFFLYLKELPKQSVFKALGSGQNVKVKKNFQLRAKKAYELSIKALNASSTSAACKQWRKVFGLAFPLEGKQQELNENKSRTWRDTEEFIENRFPVDIRYDLFLDCEVPPRKGFRKMTLREMIRSKVPLLPGRNITFKLINTDAPKPYQVFWKVLNQGEEAKRRDCIRGQIVEDLGNHCKVEPTAFEGPHLVECYLVKDEVVVARGRISVPIREKTA